MKTNKTIQRAALLSIMLGMAAFNTAFADMLTWTGGALGDWNTTDTNWLDGSSNPALWTDGNAANFETAADLSVTMVNVSGLVSVSGSWRLAGPGGEWDTNMGASYMFTGGTVTMADNSVFQLNRIRGAYLDSYFATDGRVDFHAFGFGDNQLYFTGGGQAGSTHTANGVTVGTGYWRAGNWGHDLSLVFLEGDYALGTLDISSARASYIGKQNTGTVNVNVQRIWLTQNNLVIDNPNATLNQVDYDDTEYWHMNAIGGSNNNAALEIHDGAANFINRLLVMFGNGVNSNATGRITVSGGVLNVNADSAHGNNGIVLGFMDSGAGNSSNGNARLEISGGAVNTHGVYFGVTGNGGTFTADTEAALTMTGGTLALGAGGLVKHATQAMAANTVNLSGGVIKTLDSFATDAALTLTLSAADGGVTFHADNGKTIAVHSALAGNGAFTKAGAGTLLLDGANSYSGDAIVSAGALQVDSALTLGTLTLVLDGASNSLLTGSGNVTFSTLALDTTSSAGGTSWQLMDFTGGLSLSNFTVSGYTETAAGSGLWSNGVFNFDANLGILTIPEPSTWALLLTGAALLAVVRRRK